MTMPQLAPSMSNLPPSPLTSFIGREREVEHVCALLRRDDVRLLTLTGPGGVGKTRLALAASKAIATEFADGMRFVSLAAVQDHRLVASFLARAVGIAELNAPPFADQVRAAARDTEALLLIDNFEHLLPAAPLLTDLLAACPRLKLLVTSRGRLRVSGEWDEPVLPLTYPDPEHLPAPAELAAAPAVQLFVERVKAVDPGFTLTEATAPAVAAICHRLDGLPLALELAAARSPHLSPAALLARLARRLPLLTSGPRDVPARLQTMRDAIAWSFDLLSPIEKALFRRLAVFAGGFTLDAAEAIGQADGQINEIPDSVSVIDSVASLVDKSLVQRIDRSNVTLFDSGADEPRFHLLETIREFGLEQLAKSGDEEAIWAAHAAYFHALTKAVTSAEGNEQAGFDRLESELPNLRAALGWSNARGIPHDALRLATLLGRFWLHRGHQLEGRDWLECALAAAPNADPKLRCAAFCALGELDRDLGLRTEAIHSFELALDLARSVGDRAGEAASRDGLAALADDIGDNSTNKVLSEASTAIWRELGNGRGLARALHGLAWAEVGMGNLEEAAAYFREALSLARASHDHRGTAHSLNSLGNLMAAQGNLADARSILEESLITARAAHDFPEVAESLVDLSWIAMTQGNLESARAILAECLSLLRGNMRGRTAVIAIEACALLADADGRHDLATRLISATAAIRDEMGVSVERDPRLLDAPRDAFRLVLIQLAASDENSGPVWPIDRAFREAEIAVSLPHCIEAIQMNSDPLDPLSPREREVLDLLAQGQTDQQIAETLYISRRTASKHVSAILAKLDAANRTEAAAFVSREPQL